MTQMLRAMWPSFWTLSALHSSFTPPNDLQPMQRTPCQSLAEPTLATSWASSSSGSSRCLPYGSPSQNVSETPLYKYSPKLIAPQPPPLHRKGNLRADCRVHVLHLGNRKGQRCRPDHSPTRDAERLRPWLGNGCIAHVLHLKHGYPRDQCP